MAHLYINVESWSIHHSKVVFTSKRSAIANAKKWIGMESYGEKLLQVDTYEMHDDCGIGISTAEIKYLPKGGKVINIEVAE